MDSRYPEDWHSRSRKVKQRDDYTCQNCGAKGGRKGDTELHAHHIVPISDGGSHKKSNLKTLCEDCHNAIHHNDKTAPTGNSRKSSKNSNRKWTALGIQNANNYFDVEDTDATLKETYNDIKEFTNKRETETKPKYVSRIIAGISAGIFLSLPFLFGAYTSIQEEAYIMSIIIGLIIWGIFMAILGIPWIVLTGIIYYISWGIVWVVVKPLFYIRNRYIE